MSKKPLTGAPLVPLGSSKSSKSSFFENFKILEILEISKNLKNSKISKFRKNVEKPTNMRTFGAAQVQRESSTSSFLENFEEIGFGALLDLGD